MIIQKLLYLPRHTKTYESTYVLSRFLLQFIDPYYYKWNKGADYKSVRGINEVLSSRNAKEIGKLKFTCKYLTGHLEAESQEELLYYCNKPDSFTHFTMLDFDPIEYSNRSIAEICQITQFLNYYLGINFWDEGSSTHSLNYYLMIDTQSLFDIYFFSDLRYPAFMNHILSLIADIFRFIFNQRFHVVKFCGIRGTISDYDYNYSKDGKRVYYHRLISPGLIAKLPSPVGYIDYRGLYQMKPVDILCVIDLTLYLFYSSSFAPAFKNHAQYGKTVLSVKELETLIETPVDKAHPIFSSGEEKSGVASIEEENIKNSSILMPGKLSSRCNEIARLQHIKSIPNAYERSIEFRKYLHRRIYLREKRDITFEEYRTQYRLLVGTGSEDPDDVRRLRYVYDRGKTIFKPEKIGSKNKSDNKKKSKSYYYVGKYENQIKKLITPEHIRLIQKSQRCKSKCTMLDVDIAAGWMFLSLVGKIDQKEWCSKEFSVPLAGLEAFFDDKKEAGYSPTGADHHKVKVLITVLEEMDWIECIDTTYYHTNKGGRARRYLLTIKHPEYVTFENIVGKEKIEKWAKWGRARKQREPKKHA